MAEHDAISHRLAALREDGESPDSAAARLAEEHRAWLGQNHYECGYETHRELADTYVADPRFTATYEVYGAGFATYLRETRSTPTRTAAVPPPGRKPADPALRGP